MSIEEKILNAKPSDWLTYGMPKWKAKLIILKARMQVRRVWRMKKKLDKALSALKE